MYVTQGLRRAAQVKANAAATVFRDRRRTWREVEDRVARLASGLLGLGLSKGGRAAILALNSDRYFEYLLAVPMAGGAVVPINIRLAAPEVQYILEDSGAEIHRRLFCARPRRAQGKIRQRARDRLSR